MKTVSVYLILAIVITLLSGFYQRASSEIGTFGNVCNIDSWMQCYAPKLSGGFPFAFLYDFPGISVEGYIGGEDDFRWYPFIIDLWIYFILLVFGYKALLILKS